MIAKKQESTIENQRLVVFLPGMTGGGEYVTALRQVSEWFVPSSISMPHSHKSNESSLNDHFEKLVNDILQRSGGRQLILIGHSLGGIEMVDVLRGLASRKDYNPAKITIILFTVPGVAERGAVGFGKLLIDLFILAFNVSFFDQHVLYPLHDRFYEVEAPNLVSKILKTGFVDSPEKREFRRRGFEKYILGSKKEGRRLLEKVSDLDYLILEALKVESEINTTNLLKKRGKLLSSTLQEVFKGYNISRDVHNTYLNSYFEEVGMLSKYQVFLTNFFLFLLKSLARMFRGVLPTMAGSILKLKSRGIEIRLAVVVGQRDPFINSNDISQIESDAKKYLGIVPEFYYFEQTTHSSIGYYPLPLEEFLSHL